MHRHHTMQMVIGHVDPCDKWETNQFQTSTAYQVHFLNDWGMWKNPKIQSRFRQSFRSKKILVDFLKYQFKNTPKYSLKKRICRAVI